MKFRKKPVVVEAFKWTGDKEQTEDPIWIVEAIKKGDAWVEYPYLIVRTLEGEMTATVGDWIIKGIDNEIYCCKPDIFEKTYEPVTL